MEDTVQVHGVLASALIWLVLTMFAKAVGQRLKPGKVDKNLWDTLLDILTLLFAAQATLSLSQGR